LRGLFAGRGAGEDQEAGECQPNSGGQPLVLSAAT